MEKSRAIEFLEYLLQDRNLKGTIYGNALNMAIEALKAQLSKESTTSDLISRTETVEHLRRMLEATVPNTDYDEGFIDGVEFGISTVSTMPTAQHEPSIPLSWVEKYIEWLKSFDNEFVNLAAAHISVMVKKWRYEQNERPDKQTGGA